MMHARTLVHRVALRALLPLLLWVGACQDKALPQLPPASGEGAPAAPKIPTLQQLNKDAPRAAQASGTRAGTGSLQPLHYAALGPKETGILTMIAVEEGQRVKKNQLVFKVDAVQAELAVDQAKSALATTKVQLAQAQLDYDRTKSLRERGSVPEELLDQTRSRLDALKSQIVQAEVAVGLAQKRLSNMIVTSPIEGVVAEKRMNVGEIATMMPPSVVLVVQDIDVLELRARLPETALRNVREGVQIDVRFPATGETRSVAIKRISPTVDARTRTIEIIAEIPNPDHRLKAGMLAEVAYGEGQAPTAEAPPAANTEKAAQGGDHASR